MELVRRSVSGPWTRRRAGWVQLESSMTSGGLRCETWSALESLSVWLWRYLDIRPDRSSTGIISSARRQQAYLKSQDANADSYIIVTSEKKTASSKRRPAAEVLDFVGAGGRN
jgi:hypothetical protein